MRKYICAFCLSAALLILFPAQGTTASLSISWNRNTESDLAGYKVYHGTRSGTFSTVVDVHNVTRYQIPNVQSGVTYYVAVSAYDRAGNESTRSQTQSVFVPAPTPPTSPADTTPPAGSLVINAGAASTSSNSVTLTLSAQDTGGTVTGMRVSNDGITYSSEVAYATSYRWTLSSGYGTKTVYVRFKDNSGNWMSSPAIDTIQFTATTPPEGSAVINPGGAGTPSEDKTTNEPADQAGQNEDLPLDDNVSPEPHTSIKPVIIFPEDSADNVSLTPVLESTSPSSEYNQAEWEISSDDGDLVLDLTTSSDPAELVVPDLILDPGVKYYCRVRFLDAQNKSTQWSDPLSFETIQVDPLDFNMNGIPDDQEMLIGEEIDLDGNGIIDLLQDDMKSLVTLVGEEYLSVRRSTNCKAIKRLTSFDPESIHTTDNKPADLPIGLLDFKLEVERPGDIAEVIVYLSNPAPEGSRWYIFDEMNGWKEYPYATFSPERTEVTLQLRDGDLNYGDSDGVANGIILDPCGIGVETDHTATLGVADGSKGPCFMSTSASDDAAARGALAGILFMVIWLLKKRESTKPL